MGLLAGQLLDLLLHGGHAGHAADEHDVFDLLDALVLGVVDRLAHGRHDAVEQRRGELGELGAGQTRVEVLGPRGVGRDERQVDLRLLGRGELDLRLLGRLIQTLQRHRVGARESMPWDFLNSLTKPVDDRLVEVVAAKVVVARGGLDLEHAVADLEHGHVERAAAEVEHEDRLVSLVEAVRARRPWAR